MTLRAELGTSRIAAAIAVARGRLADQRGFSLIELLVASSLMIVVLSAALFTFESMINSSSSATARYDSQDRVRRALDNLSRDLRNVSGVTNAAPEIDYYTDRDLIFQTVYPIGPTSGQNVANLQRVRYCVDTTNPANEVLWYQVQTWTTASAPAFSGAPSGCPTGAPYGRPLRYADGITNYNGGQSRAAFSYSTSNGAVVNVHADLFLNGATAGQAGETHLASGVFLRNQDVPPTAAFSATPGSGNITLDGSASSSASGQPLTYQWYDNGKKVGTGIVFNYVGAPPSGSPALGHGYTCVCQLKVFDPAGLEGDAPTQSVTTQ